VAKSIAAQTLAARIRQWSQSWEWAALALGLAATLFAWKLTRDNIRADASIRFEQQVEQTVRAVQERMKAYEAVLRGAAGLFNVSETLTRLEWRKYALNLRLEETYPGIQGIGFAPLLVQADKAQLIQSARDQGLTDYDVRPPGDRALYVPVLFTEPYAGRNLRAPGYDMFSEQVRRAALIHARDTGLATLSGKVTLVTETQQDRQPGALMFVPVYRQGTALESVQQRRAALKGFIFSSFRMGDLMHGILGARSPEIDIEILDGKAPDRDAILYDNDGVLHFNDGNVQRFFTHTAQLAMAGTNWTLHFTATPAFATALDHDKPLLILSAGALSSLLLFALVRALATREARASSPPICSAASSNISTWSTACAKRSSRSTPTRRGCFSTRRGARSPDSLSPKR
jgi:CHASE1-domain containing sensor protein